MQQSPRRQIDHYYLVGLPNYPVWNRFADPDASDVPNMVVQALQVLYVHRRENVDAGVQHHLHIFPPLGSV